MDTQALMNSPSSSTATTPAVTVHASTEVPGKATRRRFTLGYKRKIVALAAGLPDGELGAMLRREGLCSSHLTHWRRQVAALDAWPDTILLAIAPDGSWKIIVAAAGVLLASALAKYYGL